MAKSGAAPCPIHNPKQDSTSFSYVADGKFHCFSCEAKGRGAIDLVKLVKNLGFIEAVEFLGPVPPPTTKTESGEAPVASDGVLKPLEKDTLFCCGRHMPNPGIQPASDSSPILWTIRNFANRIVYGWQNRAW
jgi:hypothetical protein